MLTKEYLDNPRISQSQLKWIFYGAEEFKFRRENPSESTDSQLFGSAFHLKLLQPHLFDDHVLCLEKKLDMRTKESKQIVSDNPDKILLNPDDVTRLDGMIEAFKANTDARKIMSDCVELEYPIEYDYKGIAMKAQLDGLGVDFVMDIKTTKTLNDDFLLAKDIRKYRYHFQAASYLQASNMQFEDYYIIFVRTEAPFTIIPVKLSPEILSEGKSQFDRACDMYNSCLLFNPQFKSDNRIKVI